MRLSAIAIGAAALLVVAAEVQASNRWSVSFGFGYGGGCYPSGGYGSVTIGYGRYCPPVAYAPAPIVYAPAPVYCPPPVVYSPPVVYAPAVVYAPPVVYTPPVVYAPPAYCPPAYVGYRGYGRYRY